MTLPKTQCLPSSHEVWTVQRKNWEPVAAETRERHATVAFGEDARSSGSPGAKTTWLRTVGVRAGVGHGQDARAGVLQQRNKSRVSQELEIS